jgi:hypothetical protein
VAARARTPDFLHWFLRQFFARADTPSPHSAPRANAAPHLDRILSDWLRSTPCLVTLVGERTPLLGDALLRYLWQVSENTPENASATSQHGSASISTSTSTATPTISTSSSTSTSSSAYQGASSAYASWSTFPPSLGASTASSPFASYGGARTGARRHPYEARDRHSPSSGAAKMHRPDRHFFSAVIDVQEGPANDTCFLLAPTFCCPVEVRYGPTMYARVRLSVPSSSGGVSSVGSPSESAASSAASSSSCSSSDSGGAVYSVADMRACCRKVGLQGSQAVHIFQGTGTFPDVDRLYVRERLRTLQEALGPYLSEILIEMPCDSLQGGFTLRMVDLLSTGTSSLVPAVEGASLFLVDRSPDHPVVDAALVDFFRQTDYLRLHLLDP